MFETMTADATNRSRLLPRAMRANAVFSAVSGVAFLLAPGGLSRVTGIEPAPVFTVVGAGLAGYAIWLWLSTRGEVVSRGAALTAIVADCLWVVGSIVVLVGGFLPLTTVGVWVVAIIADVVGIFAVVQFVGLRRSV
jgi:hypothetical protein